MARPTRKLLVLAVAAVSLVSLSSCGDGESADPAPTAPTTATSPSGGPVKPVAGVDLSGEEFADLTGETEVTVQARDNVFVKPYVEVKAGTTVTFANKGRNQHDVVPAEDGAFPAIDADAFEPGASGTVTFDEVGDYPYYCTLHGTTTKGMVGAVRVVE